MKNFVSSGATLDFTAPGGGVTSGVPVKIGEAIVIPVVSAAAGETFAGAVEGVFDVPAATHATDQAWTEGMVVYWDDSAKKFTKTASTNKKAGYAAAAKASDADVGRLKLIPNV